MSEHEDRQVVGVIRPGPDGAEPVFTILRHRFEATEVRPCGHGSFILDDRWNTVTCGLCKERVDAFAALLSFAEWWEKMGHRRQHLLGITKGMLIEDMRRMRRLRDVAPEETAELDRLIARHAHFCGGLAVEEVAVAELQATRNRIQRAVDERKSAKRRSDIGYGRVTS